MDTCFAAQLSASGSHSQQSYGYAPSSVVSTNSSSWEDAESNYDAQATAQVQVMLEQLETFLYGENRSFMGIDKLLTECNEWSILFPHLRVRGLQIDSTKDLGFELISRSNLRSHSPYFFVPESTPPTSKTGSRHVPVPLQSDGILPLIEGIGLSNEIVTRKVHSHDSAGFTSPSRADVKSIFNYADTTVQESLKTLGNCTAHSEERWNLFAYIPNTAALDTAREQDEEEDRCPTPTPENPNPQPINRESSISQKEGDSYTVQNVRSGDGGMKGLTSALANAPTPIHAIGMFAILAVPPMGSAGLPPELTNSLLTVLWLPASKGRTPNSEFEISSSSPILNGYDVHRILSTSHIINGPTYEVLLPQTWRSDPVYWGLESFIKIEDEINAVGLSNEHCDVENGSTEEYFAKDIQTAEEKEQPRCSSGKPVSNVNPLTPQASIYQDIAGHVFDDIWAELVPLFYPILESFNEDMIGAEDMDITRGTEQKFSVLIDPDDFVDEDGLLSAMTIRPVSLQRRETSARLRSTQEQSLVGLSNFLPEPGFTSRPMSARTSVARTNTMMRPTSARPTSGRVMDVSNHGNPQNQLLRYQAATQKSGMSAWKRGYSNMRLLPLPAVAQPSQTNGGTSMNDMVYGTRLQAPSAWEFVRPSTSSNVATKRLPPIRNLGPSYLENADYNSASKVFVEPFGVIDDYLPQYKAARHVLFDTPESDQPHSRQRPLSPPRPASAKRQPSASLRKHRPHTAIASDETKSNPNLVQKLTAKLPQRQSGGTWDDKGPSDSLVAPVTGTRVTRQDIHLRRVLLSPPNPLPASVIPTKCRWIKKFLTLKSHVYLVNVFTLVQ
ncbi:hypothetical protein DFS34DRAFT_686717, partial [Phlyctochytrium arcticum]